MATATAKKTEVLELKNMIGGEFVDPAEGASEDVVNPANGEVIAKAPLSTKEDVDKAVAAARKACESLADTTPSERQVLLLKLADAFEERADEITDLETMDAGKPRQAMFDEEIGPMVDQLRFFAGAAPHDGGQGRRASTWRATPPTSAASRSAWSARSPPGTTR